MFRGWLAALVTGVVWNAAAQVASTPQVGAYVSSARSFTTSSYWIEGREGLILVDTQFLPSEAAAFADKAERDTGKKARVAFVLHPNPDKYNGTATLQARGVKVLTSEQVKALIPDVHELRKSWFYDDYAPDYPKETPAPDTFGAATKILDIDGVHLVAHVLGAGCSGAHVVLQVGGSVFVGDLVNPANHAWLELGTIDEWVARLEEIRLMRPAHIYPGRGPAGGVELLDRQIEYLRFVQHTVRDAEPHGDLGRLRKLWLQWQIESAYPDLRYPRFMGDGLTRVWEVEARKRDRPRSPAR